MHLLAWSSSYSVLNRGLSVLAATPSTVFRIWETRTWTHETWNVLKGELTVPCRNLSSRCANGDKSHQMFLPIGQYAIKCM